MHILELLDMLGFPMDENGTYLFKEVVKIIANKLRLNKIKKEELFIQLENPYSQFYFDIARNDLDLGIKCFHTHLEKMLSKIDLTNSSLGIVVFGDLKEANYGITAYHIAEYIVQILNMNPALYETPTRKRKIVNLSDYAWYKMV